MSQTPHAAAGPPPVETNDKPTFTSVSIALSSLSLVADAVAIVSSVKQAPILLLLVVCGVGTLAGLAALVSLRGKRVGGNVIVGVLLVAIGVFCGGAAAGDRWLSSSSTDTARASLTISLPADTIPRCVTLHGKGDTESPEFGELWIAQQSKGAGGWYFKKAEVDQRAEDGWSVRWEIGDVKKSAGEYFIVAAFYLPAKMSTIFADYLQRHGQMAPEIPDSPQSAAQKITVRRNESTTVNCGGDYIRQ